MLEKEITLLPQYHPGYLINRKQKKWTCCKKQDVAGCVSSTTRSVDVCSTSGIEIHRHKFPMYTLSSMSSLGVLYI